MSKKVRRLFASFQPKHYDVFIDPDRETKNIRGEVTLTGQKTGRPSQRLTLHQNGLKITSAKIIRHDKKGDQEIAVARINHQKTQDEARIHTASLLYPGSYTITYSYTGVFDDTIHGIYPCNFVIDGKHKSLIATDLESHHAREVLPCIDEPEAKATFKLTLASPVGETALSNTPAESQIEKDGKLHTTFETTPRMSTYLLNFIFGEMQSRETRTKDGVEVRVWSTKVHPPAALDFGLQVAKRGIEFFNEYYGVPYPLKKCDLVALPDFSAAAMENWGIITFREAFLVADPATASQSSRELIALVAIHELSHQWFGDLVTMKWWNDLWLNESFANVMEYLGTDALYPDWHIWNTFVAQEGLAAFRRDAIAGVQAIKTEINHPDEINTIFDPSIVYAKGGRLLNMLMNYLGEGDFRRGLKLYFDKHAYGNTTGDDLWAALGQASHKDIPGFMNPWLERSGFPVLHVEQHGTSLSVSQAHFTLDPAKVNHNLFWPVPLLATAAEAPDLLDKKHIEVKLKSADYVRLNQGAVGHYIVHYANPEHATSIAQQVESKALDQPERLILLSDSALMARAGIQSFAATLELLHYYAKEDSEAVWDIMSLVIADARRFIDTLPALEEPLKALVRRLIEFEYRRLGWKEQDGESSQDTKLRATILALGIFGEHPSITKKALELFEAYKKDPAIVSSELRSVVLVAAVRSSHPGAFDYLLKLEEKTTNVDLQQELMAALASTHSAKEGLILLGRLKDPKKVRQHDVITWASSLLRNRYTQGDAWEWVRDNWEWIEKIFGKDRGYDYFPRLSAAAFNTRKLFEEYKTFFEPKMNQTALKRNIAIGIEELESRVAWLERDVSAVEQFFKAQT
jgi:aminopeptidase N